jgi:thioredoxin reductase (NADPH)
VSKPVILAVDDDQQVLGAVERDLKQRYRETYRVLSAAAARDALATAQELKRRNTPVALFLIDQRMPDMTGTELLRELRKLYPDAKRALLTAYADSAAAIAAINEVGLDHYLMKPWDPPDQHLYPVLDDLLADWSAHARVPFEGVRILGSRWSPASYDTRDFLSRNQIPYQWIDVEADAPMREVALAATQGDLTKLPVVLLPDGTALTSPSHVDLANRTGLQTEAARPFYDLAIVGAGPAGLACAVYGSSEGLKVLRSSRTRPADRRAPARSSRTTSGSPTA